MPRKKNNLAASRSKLPEKSETAGVSSSTDLDTPLRVETPDRIAVSEQTTAVAIRIVAATEREAKEVTDGLRNDFRKFQSGWWELGKRVKDALDRQVPTALGYNAHEWMLAVFGETASVAKIQRSLRIARALNGIPEEKVKLLTEGNAYLLTQLREKDRVEFVDLAITVPNSQFAEAVEGRREEYGIPREEQKVHIGVQVAKSVAKQWEEAEKKVAGILDIDIELKPGLRAQVFEALAALINTTPEEVLKSEMVGDTSKV